MLLGRRCSCQSACMCYGVLRVCISDTFMTKRFVWVKDITPNSQSKCKAQFLFDVQAKYFNFLSLVTMVQYTASLGLQGLASYKLLHIEFIVTYNFIIVKMQLLMIFFYKHRSVKLNHVISAFPFKYVNHYPYNQLTYRGKHIITS